MLTVTCETPGTLRAEQRPKPERGRDEVLVRIKRIGVCGTDLHIFSGNQPYLSYPRVMGHELSGIVEEAPADSTLSSGDPVYIVPYLSCGSCHACQFSSVPFASVGPITSTGSPNSLSTIS